MKVKSESEVAQSCPTLPPWTAAYQAPPPMGFFQARVLEWGAIAFSAKKVYHNLKNRTHGIDNFESPTSVKEEFHLEMRRLVSMTTDETSSTLAQAVILGF